MFQPRGIIQFVGKKNLQSLWANFSIAGIGFVNFALLVRYLSPEAFGQWVILISGASLLEVLRTGTIQTAMIKHANGVTEYEKEKILAAAFKLGLLISFGVVILLYLPFKLFPELLHIESYQLFFRYAALLFLATYPNYFAIWRLQSDRKFQYVLRIRLLVFGGFCLFCIANFGLSLPLSNIAEAYIAFQTLASLICIQNGLADFRFLSMKTPHEIRKLIQFGKYSTVNSVGLNLLKNTDTLLIGVWLGSTAVATYNLALKLIEVADIFIRSLLHNIFPKMVEKVNQVKEIQTLSHFFYQTFRSYVGILSWLFLVFSFLGVLLSKILVWLLAGEQYLVAVPILQILLIYLVLIPIDRFSGITLESLGKPQKLSIKIVGMVLLNICLDILLLVNNAPLWSIALVSVLVYLLGTLASIFLLNAHLQIPYQRVFKMSLQIIIRRVKGFLYQ